MNWTNLAPGYSETKSSWKSFTDYVCANMQTLNGYVWRGQRCENWKLESTLNRLIRNAKVAKTKQSNFSKQHLEQFKYATRGRRGSSPPELKSDNDWWALGQHHGLATPLLDWTTSPFVAAYFAFIETGVGQTPFRSVSALHRPTVERIATELANKELDRRERRKAAIESGKEKAYGLEAMFLDAQVEPEVQFVLPFSDENQRLLNQGGLFSRSSTSKPLEDWVREHATTDDAGTILKFLIPNKNRNDCLRTMNRMNINHLSLFPDLSGASRYCNLFSEIDNY